MKKHNINIQLFAEPLGTENDSLTEDEQITVAEEANAYIKKQKAEIKELKTELARQKLFSDVEEKQEETWTKEDCFEKMTSKNATNYDVVEAVCKLVDIELENGKSHPLGKDGDEVYEFFKSVLNGCGEDKAKFTSVYQAKIGNDDRQAVMAFENSNK